MDDYFVWEKGKRTEKLSPYFTPNEFECKCSRSDCVQQRISKDLIQKLTWLREYVGKPIKVTSGFRCEAHNAAINGAKNSQHKKGDAADIYVSSLTMGELKEKAMHKFFSIGLASNFIHLDIRPKPTDGRSHRIWVY